MALTSEQIIADLLMDLKLNWPPFRSRFDTTVSGTLNGEPFVVTLRPRGRWLFEVGDYIHAETVDLTNPPPLQSWIKRAARDYLALSI